MAYRQKGDLRALTAITETAYGTPSSTAGIYAGTPDTITPKDSEELTEVPAAGSRGRGTVYRTAVTFGADLRFKHTNAASTRGTTGWEQWLKRITGASAGTAYSGSTATNPENFSLGFATSATEQHLYTGAMTDTLTISAGG